MLTRRSLLSAAAIPLAAGTPLWPSRVRAAAASSFPAFLDGVRAQAQRSGISPTILRQALAGIQPNAKVLELDQHQPEFTMTWEQYRARIVSNQRILDGRMAWQHNRPLLQVIQSRFGVDPGVVVGIWGLESNFGTKTGGFNVVEALATLAWEGRRASFFRSQLMDSLRILDRRDITPQRMTGSWAGAMGQPQFMPDSYLRYAVDFDGDGRRDIWDSRADTLGSIANYLARSGWRAGEPWGQPVIVPAGFDASETGRERRRSLGEWMRMGVRRPDGSAFARPDATGALVLPDGADGQAFMVYANFGAIRRYNPSDFYALAVGLLGDAVAV
jgi:membrane-bound lytic murein transglycosylase B